MSVKTCIVCEKDFLPKERYTLIPIERPVYLNLLVHKECYNLVDKEYLENNWEKILKLYNKK